MRAMKNMVESGEFDRLLEASVVKSVRTAPDTNLNRNGFLLKIAAELVAYSKPPIDLWEAKKMARDLYEEFRRDNNGVKFGDPEFDWSGSSARVLAHEYQIEHWEPA